MKTILYDVEIVSYLVLANSCTYIFCIEGWNYLNLHCRDNVNVRIDWWFLYKPPAELIPYMRLGRNFTFLASNQAGRWRPSYPHRSINSNSLLIHTLSPIFRPTYSDHVAVASYGASKFDKNSHGSKARGVLLADEVGGVWVTHTVPGLLDSKREGILHYHRLNFDWKVDRPLFPEKETANGHLIACMSLDLMTVNQIARYLKYTSALFTHVEVPEKLVGLLPEWDFERPMLLAPIKPLIFTTKGKSFRAELWVRRPGDEFCLYRTFARAKRIFLDVYGQSESDYLTSVCGTSYGVRNIEAISLKIPDHTYYFNNMTDRMRFAVSTAAHWQKRGSGPTQHWTCFSDLDKEDTGTMGGHLLCILYYRLWSAFDNFKIKEPRCYLVFHFLGLYRYAYSPG